MFVLKVVIIVRILWLCGGSWRFWSVVVVGVRFVLGFFRGMDLILNCMREVVRVMGVLVGMMKVLEVVGMKVEMRFISGSGIFFIRSRCSCVRVKILR